MKYEVLLAQRSPNSAFAPGAHVFPGGAVDATDLAPFADSPTPGCIWNGQRLAGALAKLDVPTAIAHVLAAVRETLEEVGIAIGMRDMNGKSVMPDGARSMRSAMHDGMPFVHVMREHGVGIELADLAYTSRWVTPAGARRRFDTRFFVAVALPECEPRPDGVELVSAGWWTPVEALAAARHCEIGLALPTFKNVEALLSSTSFELVSESLANLETVDTTTPKVRFSDGEYDVRLPGEPGYDDVEFGALTDGAPLPGIGKGFLPIRGRHV